MSGLDIDTRSDIYSLGVLLYELLTGSTPFDTKELMRSGLDQMRRIIREREPVRPSTRLTQTQAAAQSPIAYRKLEIDRDLDWVAMKCMEKDRTRRYETAPLYHSSPCNVAGESYETHRASILVVERRV